MDDKQILQNANRSATQAGLIALAFQDFAAKLIKHVRSGHALDDVCLATLRDTCIRDLKNSTMIGMSFEEEAETFRQAIENAQKLLDGTKVVTKVKVSGWTYSANNNVGHGCIGVFSLLVYWLGLINK